MGTIVKHKYSYLLLNIYGALFFISALILTLSSPSYFSDAWIRYSIVLSIAAISLHLIIRYANGDSDLLSPDKLFILSYVYFHFGYLIPYAIGLETYWSEAFWNPNMIPKSVMLITLCMIGFLFGYDLKRPIPISKTNQPWEYNLVEMRVWTRVGLILQYFGLTLIILFFNQLRCKLFN